MKFHKGDKVRLRNSSLPISIQHDQEVDESGKVHVHAEAFGGPENFYVIASEVEVTDPAVQQATFEALWDAENGLDTVIEVGDAIDALMHTHPDATVQIVVTWTPDAGKETQP